MILLFLALYVVGIFIYMYLDKFIDFTEPDSVNFPGLLPYLAWPFILLLMALVVGGINFVLFIKWVTTPKPKGLGFLLQ